MNINFKRDNFYGYFDDAERFAFFSKAAIDVMIFIDEIPDIIHVHDWQAGMLPIYLRTLYYHDTRFAKVKRFLLSIILNIKEYTHTIKILLKMYSVFHLMMDIYLNIWEKLIL